MSEDRCICCGEIVPEGRMVCPNCERLAKEKPFEFLPTPWEVVLWRPFPLIKPKIPRQEYLITYKDGDVCTSLWDGYDWISTEDYFSITDSVIAWTNVPSPYKPREEKKR